MGMSQKITGTIVQKSLGRCSLVGGQGKDDQIEPFFPCQADDGGGFEVLVDR
jgi:hypothetical protein